MPRRPMRARAALGCRWALVAALLGVFSWGCGSVLEQAERALERQDFERAERLATLLEDEGSLEAAALLRIDAELARGDAAAARDELRAWLSPDASPALLQRSWRVAIAEGDARAAAAAFRALHEVDLAPDRAPPSALHADIATVLVASDPERVAAFFAFAPEANTAETRTALQPRVDLALYAMLRTSQPHNSLRSIAAWERVLGPNNVLAKHRVAAMLESRAGRDGVGALERFVGEDNALLDALAVEFRVRGANRAAEYAFVLLAAREPERQVGALLDAAASAYQASGADVAREYLRQAWVASGEDVDVAESALSIADARDSDDFVYAFSEQALAFTGCEAAPAAVLRVQTRLAQLDIDALAIPAAELRFNDMLSQGCPANDVARTATLLFANANDLRRSETFFWRAFDAGARDAELLNAMLDIAERESSEDLPTRMLDAYLANATFSDWTDAMLRDLQRRLAMSADPTQNARARVLLHAGFDARPDSGYLANALAADATAEERDDIFARYVAASEDPLSARARVAQWRVSGGDTSDGVLVYLAALRDAEGAGNHDAPFVYRGSTNTRETAQLLLVDVWLARGDAARSLERALEFASGSAARYEVLWSHRELRSTLNPAQQLQLTAAALSAGWDDASVYVARGRALLDVGRAEEATTAFIAGVDQDAGRRVDVIDALIGAQLTRAAWHVAEQTHPEGSRFDEQAARILRRVIRSRSAADRPPAVGLFGAPHTPRAIAALNRLQNMARRAGVETLTAAQLESLVQTLASVPLEFRDTDLNTLLLERLMSITEPTVTRVILASQLAHLRGWPEEDSDSIADALRAASDDELHELRQVSWDQGRFEMSHLLARESLRRPAGDPRRYAVDVGGYLSALAFAHEANPTSRTADALSQFTREFALRDALSLLRDTASSTPQLAGRVSEETACLLGAAAYQGLWAAGRGIELEPLVPLLLSRCASFRFEDAIAVAGLRYPSGIPPERALELVAQTGDISWSNAAVAFLQRGHWHAAATLSERWLEQSPLDASALAMAVQTRLGMFDNPGAERAATTLVDIATESDRTMREVEFLARMAAQSFEQAGRTLFALQLRQRIARHPAATDEARVEYVGLALRLGDRAPLDELLSANSRRTTPPMSRFAGVMVTQGLTDQLLVWAGANLTSLSSDDANGAWTDTVFVAPFYRERHQQTVAALFQRSLRLPDNAPAAQLFAAEQLGVLGLAAASDAASRQAGALGSVTLHSLLLAEDSEAHRLAITYLNGAASGDRADDALSRLVAELLLERTPQEVVEWLDGLLRESPTDLGSTADDVRVLQRVLLLTSGAASIDVLLQSTPDVLARSGRVGEARSVADPIFDAAVLQRTGGTEATSLSLADCVALPRIDDIASCAARVGGPSGRRADSMFGGLYWLTSPRWANDAGDVRAATDATSARTNMVDGSLRIEPYLSLPDAAYADAVLERVAASRTPASDLRWLREQVHPAMSPRTQAALDDLSASRAPLDLAARADRWFTSEDPLDALVETVGCDPGGVETMLLHAQERQRYLFFERLASVAARCTDLTWRSHVERARVRAAASDARWLASARAGLRDAPEPATIASYLLDALPADPQLIDSLLEFVDERLLAGDDPARLYAMRAAALAASGDSEGAEHALERLANAGALPPDGWLRAIDALARAGYNEEARDATRYLARYRGDAAAYASGLSGFSEVGLAVSALASAPEAALQYVADRAPGVLAVPGVAMRDSTIASLYELAGQPEAAWAIFEAILAADPQNALVRNNYAYSLATAGIRLEEAEYHIRLSLVADLASPRAYKLDTLAWVLHRAGRHDEALTWMRMAIRAAGPTYTRENPDAAVYFEHLAAIEAAVSDAAAAREREDESRRGRRRR